MMDVNVLLSGSLRLDGYGNGRAENRDGTFRLRVPEGSAVGQVVRVMGVPSDKVAMMMVNGRKCEVGARVEPGDRVTLIPRDVSALWRALGWMNMGMDSVFDF
jgi:hypothetical protein